jgi:hypothetical protein
MPFTFASFKPEPQAKYSFALDTSPEKVPVSEILKNEEEEEATLPTLPSSIAEEKTIKQKVRSEDLNRLNKYWTVNKLRAWKK